MKVILSTILAVLYSILSFGININVHLCHDKVQAVHLEKVDDLDCHVNTSSCCNHNEGDSNEECCDHEQYFLVVDDFKAPLNSENDDCLTTPIISHEVKEVKIVEEKELVYTFLSPPFIPIYLKEHRFTFYG